MGSSGSRPVACAHVAQTARDSPSTGKKKKMEGLLAPVLRSMNCGMSSLERTQSFIQGRRMENGGSEDISDKYIAASLCAGSENLSGLQGSIEDIHDSGTSDGNHLANSEAIVDLRVHKSEAYDLGAHANSNLVLYPKSTRGAQNHDGIGSSYRNQPLHMNTVGNCEEAGISGVHSLSASLTKTIGYGRAISQGGLEETIVGGVGPSQGSMRLAAAEPSVIHSPEGTSSNHSREDIARSFPNLDTHSSSVLIGEVVRDSVQDNSITHELEDIGRFHVDGVPSSLSRGEASGREVRRNNRRRLWESLTRSTARRRRFPATLLATDDASGLGSWNDSWGIFGWDSSEENSFVEERSLFMRRSIEVDERRRRSRQQVWAVENLDEAFQGGGGHARHCAFGRHPNGHCSCEAFLTAEETNTRASISRIVMLAEALFEVLDEIHRQSVALSRSSALSLVSSPAPEAVVDSFPIRIHKKTMRSERATGDSDECYICLIEYVDGDQVRTLPCSHEFHMACVDKWLKEIHRVCPLCRGHVCDAFSSNSESQPA